MAASSSIERIPRDSFTNAVDALLNWIRSQPRHQKAQLFEADDIIYLIISLNRVPSKGRTNPYRIPIPHPIHPFDPQSTSICLILDDRPSSPLLPAAALDQIHARNLPIASVIGLSDLKSDYRPYESRRKLCDSYDLFFADRKILPLLPRLLGKHFFKTKKIPLAVDPSRVGWAEQIKTWCESSLLYLRTGTCAGLKIGRVTQSTDKIVENALAAVEGAMELVPRKWGNLRSVHVKTVESVALPVYQAVPEIGMKIEGVWDEEGGSFMKGKKRERGGEEKKQRKEKKGRIHDAGVFDGDGGDGEVVGDEIGEENHSLMLNVEDGVLDGDEEQEVNAESDEEMNKKKKKKKKGKKGLKSKKGKRGGDEVDDREQNVESELSEMAEVAVADEEEAKKSKPKKGKRGGDEVDDREQNVESELSEMAEVPVADEEEAKKSKPKKKKRDNDVVLNDDVGDGANAELGTKKKVKKGGKAKEAKGGGNLKKITKKKVEIVADMVSDGIKKSKTKKAKNQRIKM